MKTIKLFVELEYDDDAMYGDSQDGKEWFINDVLYDGTGRGLILHSNEIGDEVGIIKVIGRSELESSGDKK